MTPNGGCHPRCSPAEIDLLAKHGARASRQKTGFALSGTSFGNNAPPETVLCGPCTRGADGEDIGHALPIHIRSHIGAGDSSRQVYALGHENTLFMSSVGFTVFSSFASSNFQAPRSSSSV
jgi:hypothetical protein